MPLAHTGDLEDAGRGQLPNAVPSLAEPICHTWRINGEGLEHASMLGYQIFIDGVELLASQGNFHAELLNLIEAHKTSQADTPITKDETPCELVPILVKFLRPEIAILGADLQEYGPFRIGDVVALPFIHAWIFIQNGIAKMYGG